MAKKTVTKEVALLRLEALCNRSEQCELDLNRKMLNWGLSGKDRKDIIESLKEDRLLDEKRYADSFANDKARFSAWGPYKIRLELTKRKISPFLIKESLATIDNEVWKQALLKCAILKSIALNLIGEEAFENRQKLYKYLLMRGFPSQSVSKAVKLMVKSQEEDAQEMDE